MAVVGLSGLMIGALVFLGVRRVEATLTGTLSAMIFAVSALRSSLPGVPPLGGHADIVVFVWCDHWPHSFHDCLDGARPFSGILIEL